MGLYDVFEAYGQEYQVKCFDKTLKRYCVGDKVPSLQGKSTYCILEPFSGELIFIKDNVFIDTISILPEDAALFSEDKPVFSKSGRLMILE